MISLKTIVDCVDMYSQHVDCLNISMNSGMGTEHGKGRISSVPIVVCSVARCVRIKRTQPVDQVGCHRIKRGTAFLLAVASVGSPRIPVSL